MTTDREYYRKKGNLQFEGALNDIRIWRYFKPITEGLMWANQYYIKYRATTPGHGPDTCTITEMRKEFRYLGFDLVVGWGEPIYNPNQQKAGWFNETRYSLVIPGYWNLPYVDLDKVGADTNHDLEIDFFGKKGAIYNNAKNPLKLDEDSGPYKGRTLTWELFQQILNEATSFYIRTWVRERRVCETNDRYKDVGFLYAGYVKPFDIPVEGHTMNRGLLIRMPKPQIKYLTHRVNDYVNNDQHCRYPINIRMEFCPYYSVFRGPSDGTIKQTNAALKFVESYGSGYWYQINVIVYADSTKTLYSEKVKGDDIVSEKNGWHMIGEKKTWRDIYGNDKIINSFYKNITVYAGDVMNRDWILGHQGSEIWTRIESYQIAGDGHSWSHGPIDNGYSMKGWAIRHDKVSNGSIKNDMFDGALHDCNNNRYPTTNLQFSSSITPRKFNTVNPNSLITFNSNAADPNGDPLEIYWRLRSRQVYESSDVFYSKDITLETKNLRGEMKAIDMLNKLKGVYGPICDRYIIGCEGSVNDHFQEEGVTKKSDYSYTGQSWSGYVLEYPIGNIRNTINQTQSSLNGQKIAPGRFIENFQVHYDNPRGYDGNKHNVRGMVVNLPNDSQGLHSFNLIGGDWFSDSQWEQRLAHWTNDSSFRSLDVYAALGSRQDFRGKFISFEIGVITPGGWSYEKPFQANNGNCVQFFLNKYPDCTINSISKSFTNNGTHCIARVDYKIIDSYFYLKTKKVVLYYDGGHIDLNSDNIEGRHSASYAETINYDITEILRNHGVNDAPLIGTDMYIVIHGENLYDFSRTWDGTRPDSGPWKKYFKYGRSPNPVLSISNHKNETVDISINHDGNYNRRVLYTIKVKRVRDSQFHTLCTNVEHPRITFNPQNQGISPSFRGEDFEFRFDMIVKNSDGSDEIVVHDMSTPNTIWKWNEIPTIKMPRLEFTLPASTSDNYVQAINGRWGAGVKTYVECYDPDQKSITYKFRHYHKDTVTKTLQNVGLNTVTNNVTITAQQYDEAYKAQYGEYLYPISLDTPVYSVASCRDSFNVNSSEAGSAEFLIFGTEVKSNISYDAGADSKKIGDTVYGMNFLINFNLDVPNSSKFVSSSYRRRVYIICREIGQTNEFWVMSKEELPTKSNDEAWYYGDYSPGKVSVRVSVNDNNGRFKPGKKYEFRITTTVQKRGDDNSMIYRNISNFFGKFVFGTSPTKPMLLFPTSAAQPLRNPPLIVNIPNQPDVTNQEISDIGIIRNGEWCGWNSESHWAPILPNYNNKTIIMYWANVGGENAVITLQFRIKSKLTGLTIDSEVYHISCHRDNVIVRRGDLLSPMVGIRNEINKLRNAYGLRDYTYPNTSRGVLVTYENLIAPILNAYNEVGEKIKSYGGHYKPMAIPKQQLIYANESEKIYSFLTEFRE